MLFALASEIPSAIYAFSSSALPAAALPRTRVVMGIVVMRPAASVNTSPAPVRAKVVPAGRKTGAAEAVTRQTARVQAIKPCTFKKYGDSNRLLKKEKMSICEDTLLTFFMVKLLCFLFLW